MSVSALVLNPEVKANLNAGFESIFGSQPDRYFSAPGRTEICGTPNNTAISCFAVLSFVSFLFHIIMSECTAAFPEVIRRSRMPTRFISASIAQSPTRIILPYWVTAGPI